MNIPYVVYWLVGCLVGCCVCFSSVLRLPGRLYYLMLHGVISHKHLGQKNAATNTWAVPTTWCWRVAVSFHHLINVADSYFIDGDSSDRIQSYYYWPVYSKIIRFCFAYLYLPSARKRSVDGSEIQRNQLSLVVRQNPIVHLQVPKTFAGWGCWSPDFWSINSSPRTLCFFPRIFNGVSWFP